MSLEVKIVRIETVIKRYKNSIVWLLLAFASTFIAIYSKKPASFRKIDIIVIDKNRTRILIGLMEESLVNPSNISLKLISPDNASVKAPISATIQYTPSVIFLIFIVGKTRMLKIIPRQVRAHIIITPTINLALSLTAINAPQYLKLKQFISL